MSRVVVGGVAVGWWIKYGPHDGVVSSLDPGDLILLF